MKKQTLLFNSFCIYSIFFLCFFSSIAAQEKKEIYSSSIWIKGINPIKSAVIKENLNNEIEINNYFNFNPIVDFTKDKIKKKVKGVIEKSSSLFIVLKSENKEVVDLFTLKNGQSISTISNQKIIDDNEVVFHKGDAKKGIIVSYLFNKNSILSKKKGVLSFNELLFKNSDNKNNVLELIYIPRKLNEKEQNIIESYLALKYGISLLGEKDYYGSNYQKIWNYKSNADYNKRVTGLGRDTLFNLYQKQSGNSEKDGLYFGVTKLAAINSENKNTIDDGTFWIWGDNGKSSIIKKDEDDLRSVKKMERVWRMQTTDTILSKKPFLQLVINKQELKTGITTENKTSSNEMIWMAIDTTNSGAFDYNKAFYIPSKDLNNTTLVFDNLLWKKNSTSLFTFVQAPDLFVTTDYLSPDCNLTQNGDLKLNLFGGKAPFQVKILSDNYAKNFDVATSTLNIPNLVSGKYAIEVVDSARNIYKTEITITAFDTTTISLNPEWILDFSKEVLVTPLVKYDQDIDDYEWYKGSVLLSKNKQFLGKEIGEYKLLVTNSKGCKKELNFTINDKSMTASNQWVLFPNPITSGASFSVSFAYQKAAKITVSIYDLNSKLIKFKDLGMVTTFQYKDTLIVSGTYMIVCSIDGILQTSKLIVK